jgi:hypothetical protein
VEGSGIDCSTGITTGADKELVLKINPNLAEGSEIIVPPVSEVLIVLLSASRTHPSGVSKPHVVLNEEKLN